jgi:hypothetical protein
MTEGQKVLVMKRTLKGTGPVFTRPAAILLWAALLWRPAAYPQRPDTPPNESGKVMILEYHLIQPEETRWGRSLANFKRDLQQLYESGYRPIGMADYIDGRIEIARGLRPFILSFDDSSPGQFRYLVKDGRAEIDPECAVGILIAFHKLHPDFALKGIFFVLPGVKQPHRLFGQPEFEVRKLRELVELGFEIGNHTLWHADLAKYDAAVVQEQIARAAQAIQGMVPGHRIRALALPFGDFPKDPHLAAEGSYHGFTYYYDAVLRVTGGPATSPFDSRTDLLRLPRIQVTGTELQRQLAYFEKHPAEGFVSDGSPDTVTFPRSFVPDFNSSRFKGLRILAHEPTSTK